MRNRRQAEIERRSVSVAPVSDAPCRAAEVQDDSSDLVGVENEMRHTPGVPPLVRARCQKVVHLCGRFNAARSNFHEGTSDIASVYAHRPVIPTQGPIHEETRSGYVQRHQVAHRATAA